MNDKEIRIKALELALQLNKHCAMREGITLYSSRDIVLVAEEFEEYIKNGGE